MKYFTFDWWCDVQSGVGVNDPGDLYRRHLSRIRDRLTPDLLRIQDELPLHDGHLRELRLDATARELRMTIDANNGRGDLRKYQLHYHGVALFESKALGEHGLPGPSGYGDLGYWEVDVSGGAFEHHFLFSSGIELHIVFAECRLNSTDDNECTERS